MNNEFKKIKNQSETRYILETASAGATSSGAIATSPEALGSVKKRNDSILAQEGDKISVPVKQKPRQGALKTQTGAGAHKDKKKAAKQGDVKHKKPYMESIRNRIAELKDKLAEYDQGVAEGSEDKNAQQRKAERDKQRTVPAQKARNAAERKGLTQDKDGTYYAKEGVAEGKESLNSWEARMKKLGYKITKDNKTGTYHAWEGTTHKGSYKTQGVAEGPEVGGSYAEQLAQKVFDINSKLDPSGRADELLKVGYQTAVTDLGEKMDAKRSRQVASHMFGYDEDFRSDFVSAYNYLQKQGSAEGLNEFASSGNEGNGPWDYGNSIIEIADDFANHFNDEGAVADSKAIKQVGKIFIKSGMAAGIEAFYTNLDTIVRDHVAEQLEELGFNVKQDIYLPHRQQMAKASADAKAKTDKWMSSPEYAALRADELKISAIPNKPIDSWSKPGDPVASVTIDNASKLDIKAEFEEFKKDMERKNRLDGVKLRYEITVGGKPIDINTLSEQGVAEGSEIQVPTEDGITMQDIRLMAGEGKLTQKTIKQAIEIIRRQRKEKQGVAEGDDAYDPLDPRNPANTAPGMTVKDRIIRRVGQDERGDARVRAGQPRSTHLRNKPHLPEQGVAEGSGGRKFIKPNFDFEWEEAERYPEFVKLGKDAWIELAKKGRAVTITSARGIDNTDAADPDSFKSLVPAKQKRALAQLEKGTVEMPIVAVYSDGRKELVGGNTRLTAMMARDGQATVWAFRVPGEQGVAEGDEPGYIKYEQMKDKISSVLIKLYNQGKDEETIKQMRDRVANHLGYDPNDSIFQDAWMSSFTDASLDGSLDQDDEDDYTDYSMRRGERGMEEVGEDKKKGVDGKACWTGYRYNGTENGKDSCVKVSEDAYINKLMSLLELKK